MTDDTPKPKPPIRPEPQCATDGGGVPGWQIALMFAAIAIIVAIIMVVPQ